MENNRTIERDFKVNNSLKEINNNYWVKRGFTGACVIPTKIITQAKTIRIILANYLIIESEIWRQGQSQIKVTTEAISTVKFDF